MELPDRQEGVHSMVLGDGAYERARAEVLKWLDAGELPTSFLAQAETEEEDGRGRPPRPPAAQEETVAQETGRGGKGARGSAAGSTAGPPDPSGTSAGEKFSDARVAQHLLKNLFRANPSAVLYPGYQPGTKPALDFLQAISVLELKSGGSVKKAQSLLVSLDFELELFNKLLALDRSALLAEFWLDRRVFWGVQTAVYCARNRATLWRHQAVKEPRALGAEFVERERWAVQELVRKALDHVEGRREPHSRAPAAPRGDEVLLPAGGGPTTTNSSSVSEKNHQQKNNFVLAPREWLPRVHVRRVLDAGTISRSCGDWQFGCRPHADSQLRDGVFGSRRASIERHVQRGMMHDDEMGRSTYIEDMRQISRHESRLCCNKVKRCKLLQRLHDSWNIPLVPS